jgi:16S rRNA (guanine1207-N2)-methyltransferase
MREAVYGAPTPVLATAAPGAFQLSPFVPGSQSIGTVVDGSLGRIVASLPPGTLERRFVLAHALRALGVGGELVALAPKDKGGARLRKELESFGCVVNETSRRHHRICVTHRPGAPEGIGDAIARGALQLAPDLGLWTQPGVFSWDRIDPGSALLLESADNYSGAGADLGCGIGLLAKHLLASPAITNLTLLDLDSRAVAAAKLNVVDSRARFVQADLRNPQVGGENLDFVIMNPPFHDGGREDRNLGVVFIAAAAAMLRKGGVCRMVANVALPYEQALTDHFSNVSLIATARGFKVYEARR